MSSAPDAFSTWLRERCAEGERFLIDDLGPSPRECFFERNSSQYAQEFYVRLDKWRRWRSALITGLRRRVRHADHLVDDAAERFAESKLLRFHLRDVRDPKAVVTVDLSDRQRFADGAGWMELRKWFQTGREEPSWDIVRQTTLNELRSFISMVLDQLGELDLISDAAPGATAASLVPAVVPALTSPPASNERFTCVRRLGEGVYGEVWRSVDAELKREVAIKFIRSTGATRREVLEHARALARVPHPNIVAVYDVIDVADPVSGARVDAVVMELVDGTTLTETLGRKLDPTEASRIATALLDAIGEYHARGLGHLDLHDDNVIVGPVVKVLDPLYFDTGLFGSTATREAQQARDLRSVRDLLVQILYGTVELDAAAKFERDTVRPSLSSLRVAIGVALESSRAPDAGPSVTIDSFTISGTGDIEIVNLTSPVGFSEAAVAQLRRMGGVHSVHATADADGLYRDMFVHVTREMAAAIREHAATLGD